MKNSLGNISNSQFNSFRKELIIAYQDGVFDIMDQKGRVVSLPQIRNFKNFTGNVRLRLRLKFRLRFRNNSE